MSGPDPRAKISLSLGAKKPGKPAPTNGIKRPHAALHEDDDEDHEHGIAHTVSHFDAKAGGAVDHTKPKEEKKLLVIQPQSNRDWKEAGKRKRQRNGHGNGTVLPHEVQRNGVDEKELEVREAAKKPGFGLNVYEKKAEDKVKTETDQPSESHGKGDTQASVSKPRTADEEAMDVLLGNTKRSDLVLPAVTEEEAFQRDYDTAPDMATLEDYARVPVEEFGAALLRGMGWKEGQGVGSERQKKNDKAKMPERRPALLGIGAKPEAAVAEEMGTWGKAAKRGGEVKIYNPVLLRDKVTGEMFTEEELAQKKARAEREKFEMEFEAIEKAKERQRDDGDRDRDRERRDREKKRERERGDDRSERDRDRDRERRRHEDSDEEYYRRKEKDKRRRERERDDKDYGRERSRRHESERDRNRDRNGDHRRDRDRRR
ncbi:Hypothetical protein R9X50_00651800 [Acrodontium crateriforme]|uniref:Pre-mRNA-splicing factor n=1 Tax=Acrodontium crateriforme TaxID=150365 RepID=A0AAQ3M9T5_9PEZI|nr:Hypothetical protein R9X50_00651800 [Acrodontium crateriforme]